MQVHTIKRIHPVHVIAVGMSDSHLYRKIGERRHKFR